MKLRYLKNMCSIGVAAAIACMALTTTVVAEEALLGAETEETAIIAESETMTEENFIVEDTANITEESDYMQGALFVLFYYTATSCNLEVPLTADEFYYYDVNGDKMLDVTDAICFLTMYARKSACLDPVPSEGWPLVPPIEDNPFMTTTEIIVTTTQMETTTTNPTITTTLSVDTTTQTETTTSTTSTTQKPTTTSTTMTTKKPTTTSTTTTTKKPTTTSMTTTTKKSITTGIIKVTQKLTTTSTKKNETATSITTTTQKGTTTQKSTATSITLNGTTTVTTKKITTTTKAGTTMQTTVGTTVTTTTYATKTGIGTGAIFQGVDVSVYQGNIDWKAAKADGVEFAIIRAGYGKYASQKDKYFDQNMQNAKAAGLPCGAYWFSYALTPENAIKEADAFYEVIKDYQFEYPVSFDMETENQINLPKETVTAIIEAFCGRMESYGYYTTLYSYASFLNYKVEESIFEKYDIWVAHYNINQPAFNRKYGLWQYSSTGKIAGIQGNVDQDFVYLDYERIIKNAHLNGF